ncbi:MAG: helix-turn-helix domain-containing protein [Dehalococcoidia bacterium]|nr:helix-turn-helix domain-containing protein [Dehalococcoidia bacterium]
MTQDVSADYVSSPQAAKILRITYVGVAQLARQGKIPAVKIANRWLIPRAFLEEFARTYEGRRGRPRKKTPSGEGSGCPTAILPGREAAAGRPPAAGLGAPGDEPVEVCTAPTPPDYPEEPAAPLAQPVGAPIAEPPPVSETLCPIEPAAVSADSAVDAVEPAPQLESPTVAVGPLGTVEAMETTETPAAPDPTANASARDDTFAVSAEVYHLDSNYDLEVYDKGQITERARLIVARLKPKIPSLPGFSFRWDYRYQHLNVDIHGVEPAVVDWWTMGENGYTGHLPRRLPGPGRVFEAVIWLPVTFVFRGRITLSLRDAPPDQEEQPGVAATTGGLRRLWTRWAKTPQV